MHVNDIPEITQLSIPEKILFVEELWESIALDASQVPVPQSHVDELHRRVKGFESTPGNLLSLEELQIKIENRK